MNDVEDAEDGHCGDCSLWNDEGKGIDRDEGRRSLRDGGDFTGESRNHA